VEDSQLDAVNRVTENISTDLKSSLKPWPTQYPVDLDLEEEQEEQDVEEEQRRAQIQFTRGEREKGDKGFGSKSLPTYLVRAASLSPSPDAWRSREQGRKSRKEGSCAAH
jgi:hypothetical protein